MLCATCSLLQKSIVITTWFVMTLVPFMDIYKTLFTFFHFLFIVSQWLSVNLNKYCKSPYIRFHQVIFKLARSTYTVLDTFLIISHGILCRFLIIKSTCFFFSREIGASNIVCNYWFNYQFSLGVVLSFFIIIIILLLL